MDTNERAGMFLLLTQSEDILHKKRKCCKQAKGLPGSGCVMRGPQHVRQ